MLRGHQERRGLNVCRNLVEVLEPRVMLANVGLDPTFGVNGLVIFGAPNTIDQGLSMTIQDDGRIVVGGFHQQNQRQARITRLLANGAIDMSFGIGGHSQITGMQNPWSLAISPGGNIIASGDGHTGQVVGAISSTSSAGQFQWNQFVSLGSYETFFDARVQDSGRIIGVGAGNGGTAFLFAALQPNGAFDPTYKGGGRFLEDLDSSAVGNVEAGFAIVPRADGGYLAVGLGWNGSSSSFITVRHLANGQRDESYGIHGVTGPIGPGPVGQIGDVEVLSDGSFFVSSAYNLLAKFTPQGEIDPIFGVRDIPGGQRQEILPLPNGNVAVVSFDNPIKVTLFDEVGNLLSQSESAVLAPGTFTEVSDGVVQSDGKVLVTGRWAPTGCSFECSQWQLTTQEYVARTQAFSELVPEPSAMVIGAIAAINLLARRPRKQRHHQRGNASSSTRS